ncbi:hypothetical protein LSH36_291g04012 [Paralvinella palmiformis]|uniref:Uncharacterized protein n=1 Tax=Paralvinella palmiformis TaxID=53620 RepID=A0AAD9JJG6_9ANNE|nr:hypothetical protein LSH36_291g04012 [Paralvinella palmiformis]
MLIRFPFQPTHQHRMVATRKQRSNAKFSYRKCARSVICPNNCSRSTSNKLTGGQRLSIPFQLSKPNGGVIEAGRRPSQKEGFAKFKCIELHNNEIKTGRTPIASVPMSFDCGLTIIMSKSQAATGTFTIGLDQLTNRCLITALIAMVTNEQDRLTVVSTCCLKLKRTDIPFTKADTSISQLAIDNSECTGK